MTQPQKTAKPGLFALIGPGLLVAATGVGAGDLATASFVGSRLGTAILWAVVVGAFFKFVLTEGLARWQLATGTTFIEGVSQRFGPVVGWLFLPYLILWSFFVGSALMSACGVTLHALIPVFSDAADAKIVFGLLSSMVGLGLVLAGGYRLFERIMGIFAALMFTTVVVTALILWPGTAEVLRGLVIPTVPDAGGSGAIWTVALVGGVGGTVTILCYGYWIREEGRDGLDHLPICRIDLGLGYLMTAIFGISMVIVGSTVEIEGRGAGLLVTLADRLEGPLGPIGRWVFLIGAFGAVFSSLLGVWQSVPYLFADLWALFFARGPASPDRAVDTRARPYRLYLFAIAGIPAVGLWMSFREVQKLYAVIGSAFIPLLAVALLILNGRRAWVGEQVNRPATIASLAATLLFFAAVALM